MSKKFEGKVAIVTGSNSGMGQATAIEFAKEGADVVINYPHDAQGPRRPSDRSKLKSGRQLPSRSIRLALDSPSKGRLYTVPVMRRCG
jgi:NAD(P)-dependent dehydrogenase (short-subunit alcohol dehydrogenase family)